jgi:hypothetical protein
MYGQGWKARKEQEEVMKKIFGAGVLGLAMATLAPTASFADWRDDHRYRDRRSDFAFQRGFDRGQEDGRKEGWRDGRERDREGLWQQKDYRDADNGYKRQFGSRHQYGEGYRRGYAEAYRQAFRSAAERHRRDRWDDRRGDRRW